MARFAERLTICGEAAEGLLDQVWAVKHHYDTVTAPWKSDKTLQRLGQEMYKRFPDIDPIEKVPGFQVVRQESQTLMKMLANHFHVFLNCFEFREASFKLMCEMCENMTTLTVKLNPLIIRSLMDLFVKYCQLHMLLSQIADRKMIAGFYALSFSSSENRTEPNFNRIGIWLHNLDEPIAKLRKDASGWAARIGEILLQLPMLIAKAKDASVMRKDGVLSLIIQPERLSSPTTDQFFYDLPFVHNYVTWVLFGYLMCPNELIVPGALDLLRQALLDGFIIPIHRNEGYYIHPEFEALFVAMKNPNLRLDKQRKWLAEVVAEAVTNSGRRHRDYRLYLRQEMRLMVNLMTDKPGLLGPKIQLVWAACALAKQELMWYFRHLDKPPPKSKGKHREEDYYDQSVTELIHYLDKLTILIRENIDVITEYYAEFVSGPDFRQVGKLMDAAKSSYQLEPIVLRQFDAVMNDIENASPKTEFRTLRLNWTRLLCNFSSAQTKLRINLIANLTAKLTRVMAHSRNIDMIEAQVKEHAMLHELWWYKEHVMQAFDRCLHGANDEPSHAISILHHVVAAYPSAGSPAVPEEKGVIGEEAVKYASTFCSQIAQRVATVMDMIGGKSGFIKLQMEVLPIQAAFANERRRKMRRGQETDQESPPGNESLYKNRTQLKKLRAYEHCLAQLALCVKPNETVVVFDHEFSVWEYIRAQLLVSTANYIVHAAACDGENMQRPTLLETQVGEYIRVMKLIEVNLGIDVDSILRLVFQGHFCLPKFSGVNRHVKDLKGALDVTEKEENMLIWSIAQWFVHFVFKRLQAGIIVYSPARKAFVSGQQVEFRAEQFAEITEIKALCRLVGPYGVRVIDTLLLKHIARAALPIKDILLQNKGVLDQFTNMYPHDPKMWDMRYTGLPQLLQATLAVGGALCMRKLIREALGEVVAENVPFIHGAINSAHDQYPYNLFMRPELLDADCFSLDAGIPNTADPGLFAVLAPMAQSDEDADLWSLLPYLYGQMFNVGEFWSRAVYNVNLDGHVNNAHCMVPAIHTMIVIMTALSPKRDERTIRLQLRRFVEVGSTFLLKMGSEVPPRPRLSSTYIFMDKFVEGCPQLSRSVLESVFPYSLLRTSYLTLIGAQRVEAANVAQEMAIQDGQAGVVAKGKGPGEDQE